MGEAAGMAILSPPCPQPPVAPLDQQLRVGSPARPSGIVAAGPPTTGTAGDTVRGVDSDGLLMARIAAGDDEALGEVYDRFGSLVYGVARRVTGNSASAEDVVQEIFVG